LLLYSLAAAQEARPRAEDPVLEAQVMRISEELRCLVCQNETIAASHADLAVDLRQQIRLKLQQGQSEAQILDFMVQRYGDFVLYRPPVKSSTWLLGAGPSCCWAWRCWAWSSTSADDAAWHRRRCRPPTALGCASCWARRHTEHGLVLGRCGRPFVVGPVDGAGRAAPTAGAVGRTQREPVEPAGAEDAAAAARPGPGARRPRCRDAPQRTCRDRAPRARRRERGRCTGASRLASRDPAAAGGGGAGAGAGLYASLGNPAAISPQARAAPGEPTPQDVEAMVAKLAERMEKQPPGNVADLEGWVMLGRSYAVMQRYPEASKAFARALQLAPGDAQVLVDQADVLAMQQGGNLLGEPLRLIEQALQNDPSNLKALALAGTAAFDRKDYAGAIGYWGRARAGAPQDSEFARSLDQSIADARAAAGGSLASAGTSTAASAAAPAAGAQSISGRVSLAPTLASRVAPGDTLFVFARAAEGPRIPLAILKRSAAELPLNFTLDDSMAMSPELKLSGFANVVISARISKSGDAMPQSGDLEGQTAPLAGRSNGVELNIDRVRP
jgi:cytochrome c-type biogenesis protein CcmH